MGETIIYEDSRQQVNHHNTKNAWWAAHGIEVVRKKLDFGDYQRADGLGNVSIDTKKDLQELAGNLGRDHARFARECERAAAAGYRLVVLVEQHPEFNGVGCGAWTNGVCQRCRRCNPRERGRACLAHRFKPIQGPQLAAIMSTMSKKYGVRFEFCARRDTARRICELLGIEVDQGE